MAATLALVSGLLLVPAFPPYDLWWLAPVSMALLALSLRGRPVRVGAGFGLLHGVAFFVPLLQWSGIYVGVLPWLLLAALQTAFVVAFGAVAPAVLRLRWWPLAFAALWVAQEALRGRVPFGGFTWGRLAFAVTDAPLLGLAALGGAPLVSFATALVGALLAAAVLGVCRRSTLPALGAGLATAGVLTLGLLVPLVVPVAGGPDGLVGAPQGQARVVAVIQGNVPQLGLDFNAQREAVLRNHVERTVRLAEDVAAGRVPQPDLVVWPENSSDIDPLVNPGAGRQIDTAARAIGVPVLVGAVLDGPGRFRSNAGIVWDPVTGPGETYLKQHPVPFAEYVPLPALSRAVSDQVELIGRDVYAGGEVGVMQLGPATIGDVICFEVAYDGLVRETVTDGAELLVVQTNNATFGLTGQSAQQLAMSRVRAVEHGRPVLVAATSGLSAIIAADGSVLADTELFTDAALVETVTGTGVLTPATRVGVWPEAALCAAGLLAALVGWRRTGRTGRGDVPAAPGQPPADVAPRAATLSAS